MALQGSDRIAELRVDGVDPTVEAARWIVAFEPSIAVDGINGELTLRSASLTTNQLEDAWLCALANERLLVANAGAREAALTDLFA